MFVYVGRARERRQRIIWVLMGSMAHLPRVKDTRYMGEAKVCVEVPDCYRLEADPVSSRVVTRIQSAIPRFPVANWVVARLVKVGRAT